MVVLDRYIVCKRHIWYVENIGGYRGIKRTKRVKSGVDRVLKTELGDEATSTVSQTATAKNTITTALTFKRCKNECLKQWIKPTFYNRKKKLEIICLTMLCVCGIMIRVNKFNLPFNRLFKYNPLPLERNGKAEKERNKGKLWLLVKHSQINIESEL